MKKSTRPIWVNYFAVVEMDGGRVEIMNNNPFPVKEGNDPFEKAESIYSDMKVIEVRKHN